jgi:LysM domain
MRGMPNQEKPVPLVSASYTPLSGVRYPVKKGDTWITIARSVGIDPWDLIDFNFPGTKRVHATNPERASRQVNWYLREYLGCQTTLDGENWVRTSGGPSMRDALVYASALTLNELNRDLADLRARGLGR